MRLESGPKYTVNTGQNDSVFIRSGSRPEDGSPNNTTAVLTGSHVEYFDTLKEQVPNSRKYLYVQKL